MIKCVYCETDMKNLSVLNNHQKKAKYCLIIQGKLEEKNTEFKCSTCDKILSTKQSLQGHIKICCKNKKKDKLTCEYCNTALSTKYILNTHFNICNKKKDSEIILLKQLNKQMKIKFNL